MQRGLSAIAIAALIGGGFAVAAQAQTPASPSTAPSTSSPSTHMPGSAASPTQGMNPSMNPGMNQGMNAGRAAGTSHGMTGAQAVNPTPDDIRQAQEMLKSQGLYRGEIDGIMGPETEAALRQFQQRNGLPANAQLDEQTMARLSGASGAMGSGSSAAPGHGPASGSSSPGMPAPGAHPGASPSMPGAAPSTSPAAPGTAR